MKDLSLYYFLLVQDTERSNLDFLFSFTSPLFFYFKAKKQWAEVKKAFQGSEDEKSFLKNNRDWNTVLSESEALFKKAYTGTFNVITRNSKDEELLRQEQKLVRLLFNFEFPQGVTLSESSLLDEPEKNTKLLDFYLAQFNRLAQEGFWPAYIYSKKILQIKKEDESVEDIEKLMTQPANKSVANIEKIIHSFLFIPQSKFDFSEIFKFEENSNKERKGLEKVLLRFQEFLIAQYSKNSMNNSSERIFEDLLITENNFGSEIYNLLNQFDTTKNRDEWGKQLYKIVSQLIFKEDELTTKFKEIVPEEYLSLAYYQAMQVGSSRSELKKSLIEAFIFLCVQIISKKNHETIDATSFFKRIQDLEKEKEKLFSDQRSSFYVSVPKTLRKTNADLVILIQDIAKKIHSKKNNKEQNILNSLLKEKENITWHYVFQIVQMLKAMGEKNNALITYDQIIKKKLSNENLFFSSSENFHDPGLEEKFQRLQAVFSTLKNILRAEKPYEGSSFDLAFSSQISDLITKSSTTPNDLFKIIVDSKEIIRAGLLLIKNINKDSKLITQNYIDKTSFNLSKALQEVDKLEREYINSFATSSSQTLSK